ncbi:delta-aminolevulinic acid dehydratase [Flagellimonas taeanensis]|uniref:delta-aminolevulinic acid dehydratase n=1 Tax=Flavobacteriaceae TaxID=49546 RepID=UPI000E683AD2|nr:MULTISPECIES: delta-aminolevulinic acid dehydratase [Allomuricauda]MDC6385471.1 delta-aminolevulinic acid dehydratase [Muricauda sp. SK9]RIV53021.1 delta-aminolevulinic acid dehydratase [Allomuricauda taeanensis]
MDMVTESFNGLKEYCEAENYMGWDPYDGLNSWVIQRTFLGKSSYFRLAWIQLFKRSPFNFRKIFGVKKGYNPKGIGLFVIAYCNMAKLYPDKKEFRDKVEFLADKLVELRSNGYSGACWGYNFDWQARAFYQPKGTPTVVATSFVVESLFMAFDLIGKLEYKDVALSSAKFVLKDLNRTYDESNNYTLSYSALDNTQVFNAGLLGAKLLALCYRYGGKEENIKEAKRICAYVCNKQNDDGSWAYSTLPYHQWVDSFHTGFNLECLYAYTKISGDNTFQENIDKGLKYYLDNFFMADGRAKYYNNKVYPIDIHSPAQLTVTLCKMNLAYENIELVDRVLKWTIDNMQDGEGFFYYQKKKNISSKIPYMRWAQSWMLYAMSFYIKNQGNNV